MAMEKITFGNNLPGYEFGPKTGPAVLVIQEWWGVTEEVKEQAMVISKSGGFRVLIPDLYKGKLGVDAEEAGHLMNNLDWAGATKELTAAVDYLKSTGASKVGVTGFCMGGALSFIAAQHAGVSAAAPFYGIPGSRELCQVENIKVPVLMQFGALDNISGFSDQKTAEETYNKMKAANCEVTLRMYDGVGHAYMNGYTTDAIDKMTSGNLPRPTNLVDIQNLSRHRLLAFFTRTLM